MKKHRGFLTFLLLASAPLFAQEPLVFKGTIRCVIAADERATRGAQNVLVVPGFVPSKSGLTGPQGYYELNTSWPLERLNGKYVMLYFVSSCQNCEIKRNVFVSDDQIRYVGSKKLSYLTVETVQMRASCKNAELKPLQSDSIYTVFAKLPPQDLERVSAVNVVTATPGVLNLLTTVATAAAVGGGDSQAETSVLPGKIRYGKFLFASAMNLSPNTGFNFAPARDLSEAVFWNPAALAGSFKDAGVHVLSNFRTNHKVSAYVRLLDRLWLGGGFLYNRQDEFRPTLFSALNDTVGHLRTLNEYAIYLAPSVRLNKQLSVGLSVKTIAQKLNRPRFVVVPNQKTNIFLDSTEKKQRFDADLSVHYSPIPALSIGLNLMNLAGTELSGDSYPVRRKDVPVQRLRSLGLGLCYKLKQVNAGADVLLTQDGLYDVSLGVNYIPLNNVLLNAGYAVKQHSFSAGLRIKYFRIAYVNDNGWLVNERRNNKSSLLNGYLYSGLSFTF